MKTSEVYATAENVYSMYKNYLDKTFINECIHFQSHIQNLKDHPKSIIYMSVMMKKHELEDISPYVTIALCMFLCTTATYKLHCGAIIFDTSPCQILFKIKITCNILFPLIN